VPTREFYLYFISPRQARLHGPKAPPTKFFRLTGKDDEFTQSLKLYPPRSNSGSISAGVKKQTYEKRRWSISHADKCCVTIFFRPSKCFRDLAKKSVEAQGRRRRRHVEHRAVNPVASNVSANTSPTAPRSYPHFFRAHDFGQGGNATQAGSPLRGIASHRTKQANGVLDALELLEPKRLTPRNPLRKHVCRS